MHIKNRPPSSASTGCSSAETFVAKLFASFSHRKRARSNRSVALFFLFAGIIFAGIIMDNLLSNAFKYGDEQTSPRFEFCVEYEGSGSEDEGLCNVRVRNLSAAGAILETKKSRLIFLQRPFFLRKYC